MSVRMYFGNSGADLAGQAFGEALCLALAGAFWCYRKYAAVFFVMCFFVCLAGQQLHFIIIDDDSVREFAWFRIRKFIPAKDISRAETSVQQKSEMLCIYSKEGVLKAAYSKKLMQALLDVMRVDKEAAAVFLEDDSEDFCRSCGSFLLCRETVSLDGMIAKRTFFHRTAAALDKGE